MHPLSKLGPVLLAVMLTAQFVCPDCLYRLRHGRDPDEREAAGMRLWSRSVSLLAGAGLALLAISVR